ncbi:MAG TPA: LytR C-terminal domain-containing protein, partial [Aquihabitans sp.]|nr:LytR C-terminal domain-containing protein [Aquihabitans sp.]
MPPEPSTPPSRPRPGADLRRRALGLDPSSGTVAPAPAPAPAATPRREPLAAALARIPDLHPGEGVDGRPSEPVRVDPAVAPEPSGPRPVATLVPSAEISGAVVAPPPEPEPDPEVGAGPEPSDERPRRARRTRTAPPPRPPWWRRIAFAVALVVLIAAIPALGYVGAQLIADSKAGSFTGSSANPSDPGFEAPVDPTPTALVIQKDAEGVPTALTFLSLGGADGGGSVIFIPLETEVAVPRFGIGNLKLAWEATPRDQPAAGIERLTSQVALLLNVGITETIELTDASWEQLTAPVAPIQIQNPDALDLGFGTTVPSGAAEVPAAFVGPYLSATLPGQNDLARLVRHEALWRGWLDQVAASTAPDAVPGETTAGIGRFARALADGPVDIQTLPVEQAKDPANLYLVDSSAVKRLVTEAVPSPTAAAPGTRFTVRLLNGVSADAIPGEVVREIVGRGGAVTILGNGPEFGTDETEIVYGDPRNADVAKLVATSLGATGSVRLDREAPDTVDLTIV